MNLTKQDLQDNFKNARETNSPYILIGISAEGVDEVIVIPKKSFDAKEKFYLGAYNDDLTHVMNKNVHIQALAYGDAEEVKNIF